jgi:RNA polymerase sigma-70 factor (ECF subfamily)
MSQKGIFGRLMHKNHRLLKTFEATYAENYTRLYRLAIRMVDDKEAAADIVQDVFTALYEKWEKGYVVLYVSTWLYRTTINKSTDVLKRKRRHGTLDEVRDLADEEMLPERRERERQVQLALNRMKHKERALLMLYSEGFSYKEIAETTGIRFSSVGKTLARALEKMENELKTHSYEMY